MKKIVLQLFCFITFLGLFFLHDNYEIKSCASSQLIIENAKISSIVFQNNSIIVTADEKIYDYDLQKNEVENIYPSNNSNILSLEYGFAIEDQIIYYTASRGLHKITNGNTIDIISTIDNLDIGKIKCINRDYKHNIYFLDNSHKLYYCDNIMDNAPSIELLSTLDSTQINIEYPTYINITYNSNVFLLNNNNLFLINSNSGETTKILTLNSYEKTKRIFSDYNGNLFIVAQISINETKIIKIVKNDNQYEITNSTSLSTNSIIDIAFDEEYGCFYYVEDANKSQINVLSVDNSFANNLSTLISNQTYDVLAPIEENPILVKTKSKINIYKYPIDTIILKEIDADYSLITLGEVTIKNDLIYYNVLITVNDLIQNAYVLKSDCEITVNNACEKQMKIANMSAQMFKYPTTKKFFKDSQQTSFKISTIDNLNEVTVTNELNDYKDENQIEFYQVKYNNQIGFVIKSSLIEKNPSTHATIKSPTAKIVLPKGINEIPLYNNIKKDMVLTNLNAGDVIFIYNDSFNPDSDLTYVEFLSSDNQYYIGYVQSNYIESTIESAWFLVGIVSIIFALLLILIVVWSMLSKRKIAI